VAVEIDILDAAHVKFPPPVQALVEIGALTDAHILYIPEEYLLARKIQLCHFQKAVAKKVSDATDAYFLLVDLLSRTDGPLESAAKQKQQVEGGITDVVEHGRGVRRSSDFRSVMIGTLRPKHPSMISTGKLVSLWLSTARRMRKACIRISWSSFGIMQGQRAGWSIEW
jgi:hypothetical protein